MRKGLMSVIKENRQVNKGERGGKFIQTKSGRRVYIRDNGSSYINQQKITDKNE